MPLDGKQDCLCRDCLGKVLSRKIDEVISSKPFPEIIEEAKKYNVGSQLIEYIDYVIQDGNYVFTKWYHLKRGFCCGNGCGNCPYEQQKKSTELANDRK